MLIKYILWFILFFLGSVYYQPNSNTFILKANQLAPHLSPSGGSSGCCCWTHPWVWQTSGTYVPADVSVRVHISIWMEKDFYPPQTCSYAVVQNPNWECWKNKKQKNKDRAPRLHSIQNTRTGPQCHEPRFSRELDPKADSIHLLTKLYLQNEGDQNEGKQEWTGAGGNGDSHGEGCPLRSRFEPQVCCNRGKSDYWQVREQMTRVNIMEVLLAYVQVQTEELWRGFLWENPERGNLQCKSVGAGRKTSRWSNRMMVFLAGADHRGITKEPALERELPQAMRPRQDSVEICTQGNRVKHEKREQ